MRSCLAKFTLPVLINGYQWITGLIPLRRWRRARAARARQRIPAEQFNHALLPQSSRQTGAIHVVGSTDAPGEGNDTVVVSKELKERMEIWNRRNEE